MNTLALVTMLHRGQMRAKDKRPHIEHVLRVAENFETGSPSWEAAMLHDVLEDTQASAWDLRVFGYAAEVIHAVELLSRSRGPSEPSLAYPEYIDRMLRSRDGKARRLAIAVKLADLLDHLAPERREFLPPRDVTKYTDAATQLREALAEEG